MTRQTSIEVWQQIQSEGLLTKMQRKALQVFCWSTVPLTGSELDAKSNSRYMHQRISELFVAGVVRQAGMKECSVTGRSVMAWEATGTMPHQTLKAVGDLKRRQTMKKLRADYDALMNVNSQLRSEVKRRQVTIESLVREVNELKSQIDSTQQRSQSRLLAHGQQSMF